MENYLRNDSKNDLRIQIYVLSRDRAGYLDKALQSIVKQEFEGFELVVSDNSEYDDVQEMVKNKYSQVKYVRRLPAVPALEHFHMVLSECNKEYAVIFHDDDVMMPGYLASMTDILDRHPDVSAVGCNALILREFKLTGSRFMRSFPCSVILEKPESLLEPYLGLGPVSPAPFPSYMYRISSIYGLYLDRSEGGKYSDVAFLMKVLRRGPIFWNSDILMQYRIHTGNDSGEEDIRQRLVLLRYIYKNSTYTINSKPVTEFRFSHWIRWILACKHKFKALRSRKFIVVLRFVIFKATKYTFIRPGMRYLMLNKVLKSFYELKSWFSSLVNVRSGP